MSYNCDYNEEKRLELMAQGTYNARLIKTVFIALVVLLTVSIISLSITTIYLTNKISNFLENNSIEVTETYLTDSNAVDNIHNSNIAINTNSDNNTIRSK